MTGKISSKLFTLTLAFSLAACAIAHGTPISDGLALHLDASSLGLSNGDPVPSWTDISGNGNHAVPTTGAAPTYVVSGLGGQPAVHFDGSNISSTPNSFANPYTIFAVGQMDGGLSRRLVSSGTTNWLLGYWGNQRDRMYAGGWVLTGTTAPGTDPHIYAATGTGALTTFYGDGAQLASNSGGVSAPGSVSLGGWGQSGTETSSGEVAEVLVYDRVLNAGEQQAVGDFLASKYGIATTYDGSAGVGTVSKISGPGDLDLAGSIEYAVDVYGDSDRVVSGVAFRDDKAAIPGYGITASNFIDGWGTKPEYGGTTDDNNLEQIVHDIRWGSASTVEVNLDVVAGREYKLQLISSENGGGTRNYDIEIEGQIVVDEYNSRGGVAYNVGESTIYTHTVTAPDSQLNIRLGNLGGLNFLGDRNPILQAVVLEDLSAPATVGTYSGGDAGEGLDLEGNFIYAVNIGGGAAGPVGDANFTADATPGVTTNMGSVIGAFTTRNFGTNTNDTNLETVVQSIRHSPPGQVADITLGNLVPGAEYTVQLLFADNAHDRGFDVLQDGNLLWSSLSPRLVDGGVSGSGEATVLAHTFTATAASTTLQLNGPATAFPDTNPILNGVTLENHSTTVSAFSGGDPGEGLDLQGKFVYAVNVVGPAAGLIQGANFTDDSVSGVVISAPNEALNWHSPNYGTTTNDDNLETVMQSIGWNTGDVTVQMADLVTGTHYKLQLLFAENCCDRGFDVLIENGLAVDQFNVQANQGGINNTMGVVVTHEFDYLGTDGFLNVLLQPTGAFADNNPILQGFTLEVIPEPGSLALWSVLGLVGAASTGRRRRRR